MSMNQENADKGYVDFQKLFLKYLKNWKIFAVSVFLCLIAAFLLNKSTPPVYKIESKFLIQEDNTALSPFEYKTPSRGSIERKIANETQELKSRSLASQVLERLKFDVEYYSEGFFRNTELYNEIPVEVEVDWNSPQYSGGLIRITWNNSKTFKAEYIDDDYQDYIPGKTEVVLVENPKPDISEFPFESWSALPKNRIKLNLLSKETNGSVLIRLRHKESLLQEYTGDKFQISLATAESSILLLSLETNQPVKGSDYLNMLMKTFLENELEEKNSEDNSRINFINSQITGISDSLSSKEQELKIFRSRNQTQNIASEGSTLYQQISEMRRELSLARYKRNYYSQLQNYLVRENYDNIVIPSGQGIDDPVLNRLIEDLIALQAEKSRFLATQTENSPNVREVNRKLADLNSSIKEVLNNVTRNNDLMISDLQSRLNKLEADFRSLPQTEQDLQNIQREYTHNENLYTFLLERRAVSELSLAANTPSNKIIDPATPVFTPLKLQSLLNYFMGLVIGTLLPVLILFVYDQLSVKITDLNEVESQLNTPVIGKIAKNKDFEELTVFEMPKVKTSESFRSLRTNINFIYSNKKSQVILITSSVANEGKTFCSINLASAYATSGKKAIYVSCDLYKNKAIKSVDYDPKKGLSRYLSGQDETVESIIAHTKYENLDLILSGPTPPNPVDLLENGKLNELIAELRNRYDVIIMDSPPIGLANETLALTLLSDINLFVMRQNFSNKEFIEEVNSLKDEKEIKNLYVVFNDVPIKNLKYGGYSYGYEEAVEKS